MLSLRKPSADALRRFLAAQSKLPFTYEAVGATAGTPPSGSTDTAMPVGAGSETEVSKTTETPPESSGVNKPALTGAPLVKLAETLLVLALAAHLAGGLRLLFVEFVGWRADAQKTMFALGAGLAIACALAFALNGAGGGSPK